MTFVERMVGAAKLSSETYEDIEADKGATHRGVPLGIADFATWELVAQPRIKKMGPARFPTNLRGEGVGGRVTMEFVVGVDGKVIPSSMRVISSPRPEITSAAVGTILGSEFQPGTVRGCTVPVLVRQSINFGSSVVPSIGRPTP